MEDKIKSTSDSIIHLKKKEIKNIIKENKKLSFQLKAKEEILNNIKKMFDNDKSDNINNIGGSITDNDNIQLHGKKMMTDNSINFKDLKEHGEKINSEKNMSEIKQSEKNMSEIKQSESSMVSSIFKKKSCSEKKESEKYSQSRSSTSITESIRRIKNTVKKTETLVGGTIKETTQYESSSSSESNSDNSESSDISTSSFDSSSSSSLDDETISMYSTMEGGTMTEEEINKAYRNLNKEMKYYNNKKKIDKNDIKKLNLILDGLGALNKYKK
jgi:hypothetical protein